MELLRVPKSMDVPVTREHINLLVKYVHRCDATTGVVPDAEAAKQCPCRWTKYIYSLQMG